MQQSYLYNWGISSFYYAGDDAPSALEKLAAAGVEWVELWGNGCQFDPRFSPPSPAAAKDLMDTLNQKPCSLHAPFTGFDAGVPETERKQAWLAQNRKAVEYASAVGAGIVIVHPIFISRDPENETVAIIECGEELLKEVVRHARRHGVRIALENMRRPRTPDYIHTAQLKSVIERMGDDTVGICFDTGHALTSGVDFSDELRTAGELLITLHVNDNISGDYDAHLVPGEGEIDWPQFVKDLQEIRYSGIFLFEIRSRPDPEQGLEKIHDFLKHQL